MCCGLNWDDAIQEIQRSLTLGTAYLPLEDYLKIAEITEEQAYKLAEEGKIEIFSDGTVCISRN